MQRFLFLALILLFTGCSKQTESPKQRLRINICSEPATLDPRKARPLNEVTLCRMLFEGLTRISKNGYAEPALAKEIDTSEDGLTYTFHLRKSVWSNGDPVTSYDFAESWRAILNPSFPSDIAYQLYLIKNGQKVKGGELGPELLGVETPDAETLVVHLELPAPYFLDICSTSTYYPVPKAAAKDNQWVMDPATFVGNGPFLLKVWSHADQITVVRNPSYWETGAVQLEEIDLIMVTNDTELRMFEEENLDWAGSPLCTLPVDAVQYLKESNQLKVAALSGTCFLRVNTENNLLSQVAHRKALAAAIDREGITKHILQGGHAPAFSLVPREGEVGFFTDMSFENKEMKPLVLSFVVDDRNMAIAQAIQKNWETNLGIVVQLEAVEKKVLYQRIKQKDYQLALGSWIADFNDPINFLEVFKYKLGSSNNTNWENSKYIDLLDRSQLCRSQEERKELLRQAEEILMAEMPIIPIFHYVMNYLEREGVEEIALSPVGGLDFRWARIK